MVGSELPIEAGSPFGGSDVEIPTYASHAELMDETKTAITRQPGGWLQERPSEKAYLQNRDPPILLPLTERKLHGAAFDDLFLHVGEGALEGFEFAVEFPDAQAFVPLPVPGDEVCQRRFARGGFRI